MKKLYLLISIILLLACNVYSNENKYEGVWYYHHEILKQDIYLIVIESEGMVFVLHATEKRSSLSLGVGEVVDGDLLVYSKVNPPQTYHYNQDEDQIFRTFTTYEGEDGTNIYTRVDSDKAKELKGKYFIN